MARTPAKATKAAGTALTKWDDELAKMANIAAGKEENVGGGNFISTKGGILSFGGNAIPDNSMNVIIVEHVLENHYYNVRWDPNTPTSPVCFAFGTDEANMAPHEASAEPQHTSCRGCPLNEFGTSDVGKGKACSNIRRMALITEDGMEDVEAAQLAFLKIPPTSVRAWATYVRQLKDTMARPPLGVVTEVTLTPVPGKTYAGFSFRVVEKITDGAVLQALLAKRSQAEAELVVPYSPPAEEEAPPARGRGAGKFAKSQSKPAPKAPGK